MDTAFNSIDNVIDFNIIRFDQTSDGEDYFYLMEQSALQVLREFPNETSIKVISLFSERHRVAKEVDKILSITSLAQFFKTVLPLVEGGNFPCKDLTIELDNEIELSSHDDGEVHLISSNILRLRELIKKILYRQHYDVNLLLHVINNPNVYHKLEPPDKIVATYKTFDELIEAI